MSFTIGQTQVLRTINKASFNGLAPDRQVNAIVSWIKANNKQGGLELWPITKDKDLATYVEAIGNHLGIYTGHPSFQAGLKPLKGSGDLYKEVIGVHGRVPSTLVYQICTQYKVQRAVIEQACGHFAAAQGDNGIKELASHPTYKAELKLMAMGGERVYAKLKDNGKFVFDHIGKHT